MTARVRGAVRVALPAWVVGRLLSLACLGIVVLTHGGHTPRAGGVHVPGSHGWFAWDAAWYRLIAERGYLASPPGGVRFFPLFPLLGRWLGADSGVTGLCIAMLGGAFTPGGPVIGFSIGAAALKGFVTRLSAELLGWIDSWRPPQSGGKA